MKPGLKKILKRIGLIFGILLILILAFGIYVNSILPKFNSIPVVLQKGLFEKPENLLPVEGKYIFKSATEISSLIRKGEATSVEVVTEYLNYIKNNNYKYNALVFIRDKEAIEDAKKADEFISRGDTIDKPLLGVPITIKEMFWVKGSPSTLNTKMCEFTATRDAEIVKQLKNAGAIVLGTTNDAYMLSDYQTQGEVYPTASNPFDTTRTPGGSTGGGAAALAAGLTTIEIGSDLGGSIRVPSVFCGLWSLKPSFGSVNITDGSSPDSAFVFTRMALASCGPMARTPEDLKLIWDVMRNTKPDERFQKPINWKPATDKTIDQYRIAWMDEWNKADDVVKVSEETKSKLKLLVDSLKAHQVIAEKAAPDMYNDLEKMFLSSFGSMMGENRPWLLRKFMEMDFSKTDNGKGNFQSFSDAIMDASDEGWSKIQSDRNVLIKKWEKFFEQYDFFICPVTYDAAFTKCESWKPIKADDGTTVEYMNYVPYSYIINSTGHPSITVPLGLNKLGLPIGVQIVGKMYSDAELLHLAELLVPLTPKFQKPGSL